MQILHPNTLFHCSKNYYRTKIIKYSPQYFIFCAGSCYYSQQIYLCSLFAFKVLMCLIISPEFLLFLQKRVPENNNAGQRTGKAAVKPGNTLKLDHQVSYSRKETKNRKPKKKKGYFFPCGNYSQKAVVLMLGQRSFTLSSKAAESSSVIAFDQP